MEFLVKAGILAGIISLCVFMPIWATVMIADNEYIFAKVFFDKNIHLEKLKQTDTYLAMMERYPDATVTVRTQGVQNIYMDMTAYGAGNELRTAINYESEFGNIHESSWCNSGGFGDRQVYGTTPPELIDDPPIPKYIFLTGRANDAFVADFVRYTNCLDIKLSQDETGLKADHYVAIPEGTNTPGCEEDQSCFEPYSLKIKAGDVVSFRNFDWEPHTVTGGNFEAGVSAKFDSGFIRPGDTFLYQFEDAGHFDYFCLIHPWQAGWIIVDE